MRVHAPMRFATGFGCSRRPILAKPAGLSGHFMSTRRGTAGDATAHMKPMAAKGFALEVDAYAAARPGYPGMAVDHMLMTLQAAAASAGVLQICEVGAGTGKYTKSLLEHCAQTNGEDNMTTGNPFK